MAWKMTSSSSLMTISSCSPDVLSGCFEREARSSAAEKTCSSGQIKTCATFLLCEEIISSPYLESWSVSVRRLSWKGPVSGTRWYLTSAWRPWTWAVWRHWGAAQSLCCTSLICTSCWGQSQRAVFLHRHQLSDWLSNQEMYKPLQRMMGAQSCA